MEQNCGPEQLYRSSSRCLSLCLSGSCWVGWVCSNSYSMHSLHAVKPLHKHSVPQTPSLSRIKQEIVNFQPQSIMYQLHKDLNDSKSFHTEKVIHHISLF